MIWVRGAKNEMERSNRQRAVHKLCVIDTNANYCRRARSNFEVDGTFGKCHLPWPANMQICFWCKFAKCLSCNSDKCPRKPYMVICSHCRVVCHDDWDDKVCKPQNLPPLMPTCSNPTYISMGLDPWKIHKFKSVWHWFVPNNSCLCKTTGHCKLPPERSEWDVKLFPWLGLVSISAFVLYSILTYFYTFVVVPISSSFMCVGLTLTMFIMLITAKKFSVF